MMTAVDKPVVKNNRKLLLSKRMVMTTELLKVGFVSNKSNASTTTIQ